MIERKEKILLLMYRKLVGNENLSFEDEFNSLLEDLEIQQETEIKSIEKIGELIKEFSKWITEHILV